MYSDEASEQVLPKGLETSLLKAAHVHNNVAKMYLFEEQIDNEHERFFSNIEAAEIWIGCTEYAY